MGLVPSLVQHAGPLDRYSELLQVGHDRRAARRYALRKWRRWRSGIVGAEAAVCPWCRAAVPGGKVAEIQHMHREIEIEECLRYIGLVQEESLTRRSAEPILEPVPEEPAEEAGEIEA